MKPGDIIPPGSLNKRLCLVAAEICWEDKREIAERAMWVWLLRWAGAPA